MSAPDETNDNASAAPANTNTNATTNQQRFQQQQQQAANPNNPLPSFADLKRPSLLQREGTTDLSGGEPPKSFTCPLTMSVMKDPVVDREGNSFERQAILDWLVNHKTSPVTRNALQANELAPNRALREAIQDRMGPGFVVVEQDSRFVLPASQTPREAVDSWLALISAAVGKNIRLNEQGICAFTYEHLTIVIEVPEKVGSFFIYSELLKGAATQTARIMEKALRLNYLQQETRGGCLSLDPLNQGLMFSYTDRVKEIDATSFRNVLENFIDTALNLAKALKELAEAPAEGATEMATTEREEGAEEGATAERSSTEQEQALEDERATEEA